MAFTPSSSIPGGGAGGNVFVTNFPAVQPVSGPLTNAELRAAAVSVDVDNFPAVQPVSAASLPLPDGAATEATLAAAAEATNDVALTAILEREEIAP